MDVELSDAAEEGETIRHGEGGALLESVMQVGKILAHDVVHDEDPFATVEVRKDPVKNVVHVALPSFINMSNEVTCPTFIF